MLKIGYMQFVNFETQILKLKLVKWKNSEYLTIVYCPKSDFTIVLIYNIA